MVHTLSAHTHYACPLSERDANALILQHKTIESVLERGEKINDLVDRSNALSAQSKAFYKTAKKVRVSIFCGVRCADVRAAHSKTRVAWLCERLRTDGWRGMAGLFRAT